MRQFDGKLLAKLLNRLFCLLECRSELFAYQSFDRGYWRQFGLARIWANPYCAFIRNGSYSLNA